MKTRFSSHLPSAFVFGALIAGLLVIGRPAYVVAAEAEFVGVLALALEKEAGEQLQLTAEQKAALLKLVDRRESEVLELALQLRNATAAEREAKLVPFRQASEAEGLKLLNETQRAALERLRIRRAAGAGLAEPALAAKLQLTPEQTLAIAKITAERAAQLGKVSNAQEREVLRNTFEQRLFAQLTPEQKSAWDREAGVSTPAIAIVQRAPEAPASATTTPAAPANPQASGATPLATVQPAPAQVAPASGNTKTPIASTAPAGNKENVKLRFNFRFQPWGEVLDWFAQQADLSLVMDAPPPGTLNYIDNRDYTPAEALDLMNGVLLTKGFTLVRRQRMLMVINLEDGIPPNLVPFVPAEKLDTLGDFELATTLFRLERLSSEEAEGEVKRLIGPQGAVVVLPRAGQVQVTETAGRLRLIRSVLQASTNMAADNSKGDVRSFQPVHVGVEDVLPLMRQLLDIPVDGYAAADGSLRLAVDPLTGKLLVGGKPERVAQVAEIIKAIDVPAPQGASASTIETPQLEVYDVGVSDPTSVLQILQTLLAGYADVKLTTDPQTGKLVALARPTQHATIKATIGQMQREARQVEVIYLKVVDPQTAIAAIGRLFGGEAGAAGAPKVEADSVTRQLLVRGSPAQIEQIRGLLVKMGEQPSDGAVQSTERSNVRMLPLGSRSARTALEQLEAVWPTMRQNKIRIVTPAANIRSNFPAGTVAPSNEVSPPTVPGPAAPANPQAVPPAAEQPKTPVEKAASTGFRVQHVVLSRTLDEQAPEQPPAPAPKQAPVATPAPAGASPTAPRPLTSDLSAPVAAAKEPAPIVVTTGPSGVIIASEDLDALDQFESLLTSLASRAASGGKEFTVFYLQNAGAAAAAETLEAVFGAGGGGGGGGSLLGDIAGMALGGTGGNMVSAMMGGGAPGPTSSISSSSSVMIVPDSRLNALIVQATPADLDLIEQLLKVVDQLDVPESTVNPRPRLIPIRNTGAQQIADILREVYSERMAGANRQRQPSPEEFMQMLRGGRGGAQGGNRRGAAETQKISIGIDSRTNSLIVSAPQALYEEIEQLVQTLDHATAESNTAIRVVTLKRSNPEMVQKALSAIVGEKATTTNKPAANGSSTGNGNDNARPSGGNDPQADLMRQRMEMFNQMRGGFGGGFTPGGFGGGGGPSSGGGGFGRGNRSGGGGNRGAGR
jgi:type II secretory pathway component GspD/PulD (secretin)